MASWPGPLTLPRSGHQLSSPKWLLWRVGLPERKPRACQPLRGPGQGPRPALRAQLLNWLIPQELSTAHSPREGPADYSGVHSTSRHFLFPGSAPFVPSGISDIGQTLGPKELASRASHRLGEWKEWQTGAVCVGGGAGETEGVRGSGQHCPLPITSCGTLDFYPLL